MSRHLIDRVLEEFHAEIASEEHSWDHPFALIALALNSEIELSYLRIDSSKPRHSLDMVKRSEPPNY